MRVIGLRHGQSSFNLLGLCNDDPARRVDLTAQGVTQAERAAVLLAREPIEQVFCSPLLRAERTARIVTARLGLPITLDTRLSDIRSGCDGRPVAEYLQAIAADPLDTRVNGGESLRDYRSRVGGFLDWLGRHPRSCVLLVVHEETLRMLRAHYLGLELGAVIGAPFDHCVPYVFQSASAN